MRAVKYIKKRLRAHEIRSKNQAVIKGKKVPFNGSCIDYGHMRELNESNIDYGQMTAVQ
jgi:hypothetical protein